MIKIIADSTCDLSREFIEQYDISLAPLTINIKGNVYRDRIDIKPDDFYNIVKDLDKEPTTAMPSPTEYLNIINQSIKEGYKQILCICMSSGTSGVYQSAIIAKEYFYEENSRSTIKIHVVDSKCMSHGSGWLVLKSARLREKGATFEELIEFNERYKTNVKHFLSVDDLDHLIKSGRLTNASGFIGKILKLKPIMTMKKGKGSIVAKERGRKKVLKYYIREFINRNRWDITDFVIIGYTSDKEIAENLKNKIIEETDFKGNIFIMQMGVAVGAHVGLGAISMFFIEK
ncbi:DegV family protein [Tepidibacter formicigenes]|jgi:DegV family protein with EDD domain|uniref:EDD domain protein, DegV family n=1 Tax=Tepidibacter formicigenes DSM 15518 TaxID=1123349 RepID=A0A1M6M3Q2_9FIRM|nr:DegV family protein [Tepidibacter formicigenes]SHJ78066.1 EDD domain protein, DegV family [Tepidibacter formicigenes DSM 15518]